MSAGSELAFFEEHERFVGVVSDLGGLDNGEPKDAKRAVLLVDEAASIVSTIETTAKV